MTAKQIMIDLIVRISALSSDVEPIDPVALAGNEGFMKQMYCLSINSYYETRGEDFNDKVSMAQAVLERVKDSEGEFRHYETPCSVVTKADRDENGNAIKNKCWYSWYCDGKSDEPALTFHNGQVNEMEMKAWNDSILAAFYAYQNLYPDLIDGATHYYNDQLASPYWAKHYDQVARVGKHVFLK